MDQSSTINRKPIQMRRRPRVKRAAQACKNCRERKVRCDAMQQSPRRCTNCDMDDLKCEMHEYIRRKARSKHQASDHPLTSRPTINEMATDHSGDTHYMTYFENLLLQGLDADTMFLCESASSVSADLDVCRKETAAEGSLANDSHTYQPSDILSTASGADSSTMLSLDNKVDVADKPESSLQTGSDTSSVDIRNQQPERGHHQKSEDALRKGMSSDTDISTFPATSTLQVQIQSDNVKICSCVPPCHPSRPYLAPWCTEGLDTRLKARLSRLQALDLLGDETINLLLERYFSYVHPHFPVISERDTYLLFHPTEATNRQQLLPMSLSKFNAMMSAACSFITAEQAKDAGFTNISSMRHALHSRAQALLDAGCEPNILDRIAINLLLSLRREYPEGMFDTESFLVNAYEELQVARHCPTFFRHLDKDQAYCRMRILQGCYQWRAYSCIVGTYRSRVPLPPSVNLGRIQLSDLDNDLSFSWFLSKDAKRTLARIFIASIDLFVLAYPICKILMKRDTFSLHSANRSSVMSDLEEFEFSLSKWHTQNLELMSPDFAGKSSAGQSYIPTIVHRTFLRLEYEYLTSSLHQICLCLETVSTTTWARRLREASRQSLQQSSSSIVRMLEDLLDLGAIGYLPLSAVICLLIPVTINTVFMKTTTFRDIRSMHDLYVCHRALTVLGEHYSAAHIINALVDSSLVALQKKYPEQAKNLNMPQLNPVSLSNPLESIESIRAIEAPLPATNIYAMVVKFHEKSFQQGCFTSC